MFLGVDGPRVDFELNAVAFNEEVVEISHLVAESFDVGEFDILFQFVEHLFGDSGVDFQGVDIDGVGVGLGDFLDLDSSLG